MKSFPVSHFNDARLREAVPTRRLPRPQVTAATVLQTVNLRPAGNTVTITTLADNPFDDSRPVSVRTQQSGGMARPEGNQMSRSLLHAYLPGLGAEPGTVVSAPATQPPGAMDFLATAAGSAAAMYQQQQAIKLAQAQAAVEQARAQAVAAQWQNPLMAMKQRSSITVPLLIVAGGALLAAGAIFLARRNKKRR
jgi:LPXTG-motif cell wall-anchored protein